MDQSKCVTPEEYKRALKARTINVIEDIIVRLRLEKMIMEEEFEHAKPLTYSQKYDYKILKLRIDLLDKRVNALVKINYDKAKRRHEEKLFMDAFMASVLNKHPLILQSLKEKNIKPEGFQQAVIDSPIITDDPKVDSVLESIKAQYLAGKSFDEIAKEAHEKDRKEGSSFLDSFKPNEDGSVDL